MYVEKLTVQEKILTHNEKCGLMKPLFKNIKALIETSRLLFAGSDPGMVRAGSVKQAEYPSGAVS